MNEHKIVKTEAYIVVKNCTKQELKTMLNDWLIKYAGSLKNKMTFGIAGTNTGGCVLKVDKNVDDTAFFYMVNYFSYPSHFNRRFEVEGYTTVIKQRNLPGKNIYVFIHEQEKEHDNVWITTGEGETYRFDFGGKWEKMLPANNYKTYAAAGLSLAYEEIMIDNQKLTEESTRLKEEKSESNVAKRFRVISTLLFLVIPAIYLLNSHFFFLPKYQMAMVPSLVIVVWFFHDYKIFYTPQRTIICVLLALLNIALATEMLQPDRFTAVVSIIPLSSILVMLVANKLFGTKIDKITNTYRRNKFFFSIMVLISVFISIAIYNFILKFLINH